MSESAIVTDVAAKLGERNEDFARIGYRCAVSIVAPSCRRAQQTRKVSHLGEPNGLLGRQLTIVGKVRQQVLQFGTHDQTSAAAPSSGCFAKF